MPSPKLTQTTMFPAKKDILRNSLTASPGFFVSAIVLLKQKWGCSIRISRSPKETASKSDEILGVVGSGCHVSRTKLSYRTQGEDSWELWGWDAGVAVEICLVAQTLTFRFWVRTSRWCTQYREATVRKAYAVLASDAVTALMWNILS